MGVALPQEYHSELLLIYLQVRRCTWRCCEGAVAVL